MDLKQQFATQLSAALASKGMTQRELGDKLKMGEDRISKFVNGKTNPTLETIQKICEALNVPVFIKIN